MPFFGRTETKVETQDMKRKGHLPTPDEVRLDQFDFVRFTWSDVNGIARGRSIPRRNVPHFVDNGVGVFVGILWMTHTSENNDGLKDGEKTGWPNVNAQADLSTLHALPWSGDGQFTVGEIMCETKHALDGAAHLDCPRYIARRQLDRLERMGYTLYSAFECEMMVKEIATGRLLWENKAFCNQLELSRVEKLLFEVDEMLCQAGINVESYQAEYEAGQLEMPLRAQYGITSADQAFYLRSAVKEIFEKRGYHASFFAKPTADNVCNAFHFNHSLCSIEMGENAFRACEEDGTKLNETFRLWMAGLIKHGRALSALCSPTVNCYRRYHKIWAPHMITWGMDNRLSTFRVKASKDSAPYIENRLPSSNCNPYLVLAATVAAGLDGIMFGTLKCPPEKDPQAKELPHSLEEGLKALEEDEVLVNALGADFVKNFCHLKRKYEIELLPNSDMDKEDQADINSELAIYGERIPQSVLSIHRNKPF